MKQLPKTKNCKLELENDWLTIWFNNPEKRNALSEELLTEIRTTLKSVKEEKHIRGILFRGKGGTFCAGADLKDLKRITHTQIDSQDLAFEMSFKIGKLFEQISKIPQISISVIEGAGMAGGLGIACATDIIITMADTRYAFTETRLGLIPIQIMPYVLNRISLNQAKKLMLLGNSFDGIQAYDMGMADYIAKNEKELDEHIINIKEMVKKSGPNAIAKTKRLLSEYYTININRAAKLFSQSVVTKEGKEGLSSFFDKRDPYWNS